MGLPDEQLLDPQAVSKALRCVICAEVFVKPVSSICQHVFCRACIERALQQHARCPTCRSPLNAWELQPNHLVQTLLDEVHVRCPRFGDSCGWTGPQEALPAHQSTCLVLQRSDLARKLAVEQRKVREQTSIIQDLKTQISQQERILADLRTQATRHKLQLAQARQQLREQDQQLTKKSRLMRAEVEAEVKLQLAAKAQAEAEEAEKRLQSLKSTHDELVQAFVKDPQGKTVVIKLDIQKPIEAIKNTIIEKTGCPEE
ncbi:rhp18, partial [Symbiodinium pilosum]